MRDTTACQKTFPSKKLSAFQALLEWDVAPSGAAMSLPVSSYEELLARVRSLTHETIQLQRELASPLLQPGAAPPAPALAAPAAPTTFDLNSNEHVVTTSSLGATCDNARRAPAAVWPAPAPLPVGRTRSPRAAGAPHAQNLAWQRYRSCDTILLQNGGGLSGGAGGGDEYSVAGFLARLGLALDGAAPRVDKERADEPKEEDDGRKSAESQGKPEDDDRLATTPGSDRDNSDAVSGAGSGSGVGGKEGGALGGSASAGGGGGGLAGLYHGTWPVEHALWHSGPPSIGARSIDQDLASVMSFSSSAGAPAGDGDSSTGPPPRRPTAHHQLGAKVEMVYGLLSMLGAHDREDMSSTLLAMSSSPDACLAMRKSGCLPLLVQLLHGGEQAPETRRRAAQALHNVVHAAAEAAATASASASSAGAAGAPPAAPLPAPGDHHRADDKRARREARVLKLLEQARDYCDALRERRVRTEEAAGDSDGAGSGADEEERQHPVPTVATLMKLSFDEEHRHAMCELGGLHAIAEVIQMDHEAHGSTSCDQNCILLRRYAGMALTNLTFGDSNNKALLCSFQPFMRALVAQLSSPNEDLRQVTASVLRNLSWKADSASKQTLREVSAVPALVQAAMEAKKESTLKSILSALWNLSAHCSVNKVDICAVDGALGFFVDMLSYQAPSKSLAIIENAGGILRNVSSHIAMREDYRAVLREHKCLQVLLQQLKSPSLTIVSNACGTLWNLSAQCAEDQRTLWEMGAVSMLRSLVRSKHKMISMGSSAALKNLLSARSDNSFTPPTDPVAARMKLTPLPTLHARRQKALEQELDQTLAETCDNIEPSTSPNQSFTERHYHSAERHSKIHKSAAYHRGPVSRSDSRDSVTSTHSDSVYERVSRSAVNVYTYGQVSPSGDIPSVLSASETVGMSALHSSLTESGRLHSHVINENLSSERRFLRRYVNSMKEREERKKVLPLNISCEDNERQSGSESGSFHRSRLGQIEETVCINRRENGSQEELRGTTLDTQRGGTNETEDADDVRINSNVQIDVMSLTPASTTKQNKNVVYDSPNSVKQRSAFSPLAGSPYSSSSSRTQYQQGQNSSAYTRNKYSDLGFEETESQEQPVDYSLKYVEHPVNTHTDTDVTKSSQREERPRNEPVYPVGSRGKQNSNNLSQSFTYKSQVTNGMPVTNKNMKMNVIYGDYAETDLDQPTDYSLKYPEEEEEEEENYGKSRNIERTERGYYEPTDPLHEDTLKTYCTEGTPYETPCNFSTATSMSDLHVEPPTPHEEDIKEEDEDAESEHVESQQVPKKSIKREDDTNGQSINGKVDNEAEEKKSVDEDVDQFSSECVEKGPQMKSLPPSAPRPPVKGLQSGLSSGLMSPEKPVQYCEEGTPGYFSRVSSLSSLHSGAGVSTESHELSEPCSRLRQLPGPGKSPDQPPTNKDIVSERMEELKEETRTDREVGKVVTFGGADHYAEETPLMFSRCSSLGSLSSFEQHSIHDDRSSVVSDFSRRTSGIISPSELPDSPTQTVPPSPRHHAKQPSQPIEFTSRLSEEAGAVHSTPHMAVRHQADLSSGVKPSVFADDVATFNEESTPVEFSRATSLSSLTIDDEPKICNDAVLKEGVLKPQARPAAVVVTHRNGPVAGCSSSNTEDGMEKQDVEKEKRELADCCELAPVSEGEEENDEDMLAACISIGMQNSRQRQSQQPINGTKVLRGQPLTRHYSHSGPLNRGGRPSGIPIKAVTNNMPRINRVSRTMEPTRTSSKSMTFMEVPGGGVCEDALRTYHTEGTPANISHAGSHSDLSVLSLPGDDHETEVHRSVATTMQSLQEKAGREEAGADPGEKEEGDLDGRNYEERPELSDDSSNFSGDGDNILAECIQSGMPKARPHSARQGIPQPGCIAKSPQVLSDKHITGTSTPASLTNAPRRFLAGTQSPRNHHLCGLDHGPPRQSVPARKYGSSSRSRSSTPLNQSNEQGKPVSPPVALPQCTGARDELETYATEGSPRTFSTRSSLSDLTINSGEPGATASCVRRSILGRPALEGASCDVPLRFATEDTPLEFSHAASLSSLNIGEDEDEEFSNDHGQPASDASSTHSPVPQALNTSEQTSEGDALEAPSCPHMMMASDGSWGDRSDRPEDSATSSRLLNKNSSASEEMVTVLSRNGSLSSLSVDSFGSTEPTPSEQALLEQCISSGMPKSKSESCGSKGSRIAIPVLKKKIGPLCKVSLSSIVNPEYHKHVEENQMPVEPIQKLELRPNSRHSSEMSSLEAEMTNLSLQDEACCSGGNIPKNGLDSSAVVTAMKVTAADAKESTIAINIMATTITNHDTIESEETDPLKIPIMSTNLESRNYCLAPVNDDPITTETNPFNGHSEDLLVVNALTFEDGKEVLEIDLKSDPKTEYMRQSSLYESATLTVKEELYKRQPSIYDDSPKVRRLIPKGEVLSPESNTNDSKSPVSSGESPSSDVASEGDLSKKNQVGDAMISSLDQMTQELMNGLKGDKDGEASVMKQSLVGSDTWNEEISPNDASFPSLSISAPMVASYKSDNKDDVTAMPELVEEVVLESEIQEASLTDSRVIEMEANMVAGAVKAEVDRMDQSIHSLNSMDLDNVKEPSLMGSLISLTTSLSGPLEYDLPDGKDKCLSTANTPAQNRITANRSDGKQIRKKSLPIGMMVRRALGNNHTSSVENLVDNNVCSSSNCNSHIENIKPPSAMEEVLDLVDMENSMISVASITSEVADSSGKEHLNSEHSPPHSEGLFEIKPAANAMAQVFTAHITSQSFSLGVNTNSASDNLDNINPPSLLNEMGDFTDQESLIEPGTETICSDTELATEDPAQTYPVNSPDSSCKNTPVHSDHYVTSSAESTPKKTQGKHKQLTPKQKRQLVKDRYRTYTIADEQEKRAAKLEMQQELKSQQIEGCSGENTSTASNAASSQYPSKPNKITPKQRRQEDRNRFQTQVLDKPLTLDIRPVIVSQLSCPESGTQALEHEVQNIAENTSNAETIKKSKSMKSVKQKRAEAKDRFRTRTLSENITHLITVNGSADRCVPSISELGVPNDITPEEFETLLEHDAKIVISTLKERAQSESSDVQSSDDMMIDCETLSLVSMESESELNSSMTPKTIQQNQASNFDDAIPESDLCKVQEPPNRTFTLPPSVDSDSDSETSSCSKSSTGEVDDSKGKCPRIVKPSAEGKRSRDGSVDSVNPDETINSPKAIRGRRRGLYSSSVSRRAPIQPTSLPKIPRPQSSIPQIGKALPARPTRASNLRQTNRGGSISSPSPRSVSRTPPGSASPAHSSPKSVKGSPSNTTHLRRPSATKTQSSTSKMPTSCLSIGNFPVRNPNSTVSNPSNNNVNDGSNCGVNQATGIDPKFRPPERQGTFTKEEISCNTNGPVPSTNAAKTRIPQPSEKKGVVKADPKKKQNQKLAPPVQKCARKDTQLPTSRPATAQRLNKNFGADKPNALSSKTLNEGLQKAHTMPERRTGIARLPSASKLGSRGECVNREMKTSMSNQSLKSNDSTKGNRQSMNQRSSSNCSLSSVTSVSTVTTVTTKKEVTKKTQAKKEVTSKIASLWKKVEESKKQQSMKKDTRVWITGKPTNEDSESTTVISEPPQEIEVNDVESRTQDLEVQSSVPPPLVRSSTFESLPVNQNREGSDKTAIVPPFNYSPPTRNIPPAGSLIPTAVKRSDSYTNSVGEMRNTEELNSASMKITTV